MIFLILLLGLFWPETILAAPQISVIDLPSLVNPSTNFSVSFLVTNTNIGATYYYKFFGGIGDSTSSIKTISDLSYTSAWVNFPKFISDLGGSAFISSSAYIVPEAIPGIYNFKIKVALVSNTSTGATSPIYPLSVVIPDSTPTPIPTIEIVPTNIPTTIPTVIPTSPAISPEPTTIMINPLILSEIMASPDTGQDEWIEIYNPASEFISLKGLCFYDESNHSRCISDDVFISSFSYFTHSFSSGFLNNDGDTVTFLNSSITYPKSAKNKSYSLQKDGSYCFTDASQNKENNPCDINISSESEDKYPLPQLNLEFIPDSVIAGEDFNLVFSLKSSDLFSLRLLFPFTSQYFPFSSFKDGYSWLNLPLTVSKKLPPGEYPLSFHLKKVGSSHLYDYQIGTINIKPPIITPKVLKSKILGASIYSCPQCPDNSASVNYYPASTLREVKPDTNIFSWPFLFAGSILFLSPLLFPKLYSA